MLIRPEKDEAKAEATVFNKSCNIKIHITFILHIIYHKIDISQTELT